jgi:NAD-dependent SIR2 family protein deacetylase
MTLATFILGAGLCAASTIILFRSNTGFWGYNTPVLGLALLGAGLIAAALHFGS